VFKFDPDNPILTKVFNAAVSPLPKYRGRYLKNPLEFITSIIKGLLDIPEVIFEGTNQARVLDYMTPKVEAANPTPYLKKVKDLKATAINKEHAASIADILLQSFASGDAPDVALGDTPSIGYYSPDYHVIVLDPKKNPTSDALIDTLAFEIGNALRREEYLANKNAKTTIEFGTMKDYLALLMEATHSGGINALVVSLGIPDEYLVLENAKDVLAMKEPQLNMPAKEKLSGQKLRTALAFWKMQDWAEAQREQYFARSAHGEGMAATGAGYKSSEAPKQSVKVKQTRAPRCFEPLVQEIIRRYPSALQFDFDQLVPRHYGEFLRTGRIERWHSRGNDQGSKPPRECQKLFEQDLDKMYPQRGKAALESLSDADLGGFLIEGKIKSLEKASTVSQ